MNKASYYSEILGPNGMYEVAIKIYHIHPPYSKALVVREKEEKITAGRSEYEDCNYWELHKIIY